MPTVAKIRLISISISFQLPALRPHRRLLLRLVVVGRRRPSPSSSSSSSSRPHLLVSERTSAHLPCCELNPARSLHSTLRRFLTEVFGADLPPHRPHGLLSVEHSGEGNWFRWEFNSSARNLSSETPPPHINCHLFFFPPRISLGVGSRIAP